MEMRNGFLGRMGEGGGGGGAGLGWPIGASPAPTQGATSQVAPSPKMQPPPSTAAAAGIVGAQSHQHQQPATMTGPPTGVSCKQRAKNGNT